jgi:hypothetical protein
MMRITDFLNNRHLLKYFNPHSYGKAELDVDEELKDIETAINKCVGYEATPIQMTHENRFHQEPTEFNALGVKYKGDLMYRALVTGTMEENMLGVETLRYWVISPFIHKQRANSNNPYPSRLTEKAAIRTNDIKKAVNEVLRCPAVTFDLIVAHSYNKMASMSKDVLETDQVALNKEVTEFWSDVRHEDNKPLLMEWLAHALTGNMEMYIPASEKLVERAKEHLETIKPLHEQIDEANSLVPVFVSQFGDDDVARCYTVKSTEQKGYIDPQGFVDKLTVHETASGMPYIIRSKLAAMQINEANLLASWDHYKYIPNVGAFMLDNFLHTGGKHGMVFLNPTEFAEVFPSE